MRERPILFTAPMVRALLAGTKTQTRRIIKTGPSTCIEHEDGAAEAVLSQLHGDGPGHEVHERRKAIRCPYGQPGDQLWVREAWQYADWTEDGYPFVRYRADDTTELCERIPSDEWAERLQDIWAELSRAENYGIDSRAADRRWRPGIHMPRWACRLVLEATGVRVERLQAISEADAIAEGIERTVTGDGWRRYCDPAQELAGTPPCVTAVESYRSLWEQINGPGSWEANPWVWVVEFRRAGEKEESHAHR